MKHFHFSGLQDVTAALQRVQQQLKKNGHAGQGVEADLAAVQSLLLSPAFRSALTIHSKVQEVWCCGQPTLSSHHNVRQLVTEVMDGTLALAPSRGNRRESLILFPVAFLVDSPPHLKEEVKHEKSCSQ